MGDPSGYAPIENRGVTGRAKPEPPSPPSAAKRAASTALPSTPCASRWRSEAPISATSRSKTAAYFDGGCVGPGWVGPPGGGDGGGVPGGTDVEAVVMPAGPSG